MTATTIVVATNRMVSSGEGDSAMTLFEVVYSVLVSLGMILLGALVGYWLSGRR